MTAIAKKKAILCNAVKIKREDTAIWSSTKYRWYKWGKNQCMKHKLNDQVYDVLEIIINLCNLKQLTQATKQTILAKYKTNHPTTKLSMRTLNTILSKLEIAKIIKRYNQLGFYKPGIIKVLAPKLAKLCVQNLQTDILYNKNTSPIYESKPCLDESQDFELDEKLKRMIERDRAMGIF